MFTPTEKQTAYLYAKDKRLNFLSGSVRSGKTYISVLKFLLWVASMPKDYEFIMCGKTIGSLQRNCFNYIYQFIGEENFQCSKTSKHATVFGRTVWLEGATDERAEGKIRGMTLGGAYCDEITLYPESFVVMLLTRLSLPGAKLFATCNPDNPMHFIKTKYIDRANELDCAVWNFLLTDNTHLPKEYLDNLTKEFKGVFYNRFVLGEWCKADGLVYPMFDNVVPTEDRYYEEYCVSMDYGIQNPTAMLLWGLCNGVWYLMDEYYHSGRETQEQKTDQQYYNELERLCGDLEINRVYIDPSAASFITLVRQRGRFHVTGARNEVIEGIQHTASVIAEKRILINDCCRNTIREFALYSWDSKADEDTVIKENDHCLAGDTIVHTLFGKRRIKDLVGKRGWVWSYDEKRKRRVLRRFRDVRKTGSNREMVRITLNNGKTVDCTSDHLILTKRGWVEAGKLNATDYVVDIMDGLRYNYDTNNRRKRRYHNGNTVF